MKRILLVSLLAVFLTGCWTAPVKRNFPDAPVSASVKCPDDLKEIPPGTEKLSDGLIIINENYAEYHKCSAKVESWINWYNKQKKNFESVK